MDSIIFIVDDDAMFAELMKRKLILRGFKQVYTYHSGVEFLNEINLKPDLIFLDYNLGDLTGIEVLLRVKKNSPHTEVIMVSAQDKENIILEAKKLGILSYVSKGHDNMNKEIEKAIVDFQSTILN